MRRLLLFFVLCAAVAGHCLTIYPTVKTLCENPRIYLVENFLAPWECDHVIQEATPYLARSTVVDEKSSSGGNQFHYARTSQGMFFPQYPKDRVLADIEKRIEIMTQIPIANGEGLQVLHYNVGGEYQPHFDYFDRNSPGGAAQMSRGGQRVATLIMYLNTGEEGGETIFPKANVKVKPVKGNAVLFYNCRPDGQEDPMTLHGGAPVRKGEKWIMTKWLRQGVFN